MKSELEIKLRNFLNFISVSFSKPSHWRCTCNVSPTVSTHNQENMIVSSFSIIRNLSNCFPMCVIFLKNVQYFFFGKSAIPMFFSAWRMIVKRSSFSGSVIHIIFVCSNEQVAWPNARGIIAFMKHAHSGWNFTKFNHVGKPVGRHISTIKRGISIRSFFVSVSSPLPALSKFWNVLLNGSIFINFFPKPFQYFKFHGKMIIRNGGMSICF